MNNEPIQFLPIHWHTRKRSRTLERGICIGIVIGSLLTVTVAVTLILL